MMRSARAIGPTLVTAVLAVSAACAGGPGATGGAPSNSAVASTGGTSSAGAVAATLQEWAVGTTPQSAAAGDVTFDITNVGPDDAHEFVVIRTDLSLIDLPTDETGAVDESAEGIEVVDEVEEIAVGASESLTVALDPGAYVLICNIYDEDEQEAHYQEGMRTSFTVN